MIFAILKLVGSIAMLWLGANYLVESAERVAMKFGVSELVIGLTVVALGTSAPEFAVTVSAAVGGQSSISVGNIVGSNIFNLGFILGGVALLHPVAGSKKLVYRDGLFMLATTVLLLVFFLSGNYTLSRVESGILFSLLIAYLLFLFFKKEPLDDEEISSKKATIADFVILPVSLAVIVLGGNLLVSSSTFIARAFGLSEWLIAITVVAAGTSAPELVTSFVAAIKGKHGISAGNLIGSNIFNLLGVLGVAGLINPLTIDWASFQSLIMLLGLIIVVVIFIRTHWKVSRLEGALLIILGLSMWVVDFVKMYLAR